MSMLIMSRLIASSTRLPCLYTTSHARFLNKKNQLASYKVISFVEGILRYNPVSRIPRRSFVVNSNTTPPPGVPAPSKSPSGSMRNWIIGIVLTFVVPFFTHKWGSLLLLKNKVDSVVNTAEHLAETIEGVADKVDHVVDSITEDLPEDSKLRKKLESIDEIVEGVAKSARMANEIIDKVEEVEDRLESLTFNEVKNKEVSKQVEADKNIPSNEQKTE